MLGIGWLDSDVRRTESGVAYEGDRDGLNQLLSLSYLLEIDRGGFYPVALPPLRPQRHPAG